ncbi:MAG TPA: hypothetical protein VHN38_07500, partial [Immundisolibacter sp.]|nr:hypothetical protein [Immundisolibacter sp.]
MGAFDDLIPQAQRAAVPPPGGAFDDLIPTDKPTPAAAATGTFDDLIPAAQTPPPGPQPGAVAQLAMDPLASPGLPLFGGQERPQAVNVQPGLAQLLDPRSRTVGGAPRVSGERTAPAVVQDLMNPKSAVSGPELQGLLASVSNGQTLDPVQRAALELRLAPDGLRALREAEQVAAIRAQLPADRPLVPGGPAAEQFMGGLVRGVTLNTLPGPQVPGAPLLG